MTITLDDLAKELEPRRTALLFGAGSSVPSGAPTGVQLAERISKRFSIGEGAGLGLADVASLVEIKKGRRELVDYLRETIYPLRPTGGLVEVPRYPWREIFTTNYDNLIERAMANMNVEYTVISANYEFEKERENAINIYKMHGTIDKDKVDGDLSTMIITNQDYADTYGYREDIYDRLMVAGSSNILLIVGHSLADPDLNQVIDEAVRRRTRSGSVGRVYILSYQRDEDRALLLEQRGLRVAFGGLDELATALAAGVPASRTQATEPVGLLGKVVGLSSVTVEVSHALGTTTSDIPRMFSGSPASYADIKADLTFTRDISRTIEHLIEVDGVPLLLITGVAGVGKTTAVRQALARLVSKGFQCFEHVGDRQLSAEKWLALDAELRAVDQNGVLFVDDAYKYVREIGQIIDALGHDDSARLSLVLCTSKANWNVRTKSETIYAVGRELALSQLSTQEIESLLDLFQMQPPIARLVEREFAGFSRVEKRRRLVERCRSDFFVCLRNIMSTELLDDIILREYASLSDEKKEIYKLLSGLEAAGIRVHRQTVLRMLKLSADKVAQLMDDMDGIISESVFDLDHGIYTWHGRHLVISQIVAKARFQGDNELFDLFDRFIDEVNTSYFIERTNLQELCHSQGIRQISNRDTQNVLLRKIISRAPSLRPPRHRLISNLIAQGTYERAADEIRIFEADIGEDGPLVRYSATLRLRRAMYVPGLANDDRRSLVEQAATMVRDAIDRYPHDKLLLDVYCDIGLQCVKQFGDWAIIDEALDELQRRADTSSDPEIRRLSNNWVVRVQDVKSGRT